VSDRNDEKTIIFMKAVLTSRRSILRFTETPYSGIHLSRTAPMRMTIAGLALMATVTWLSAAPIADSSTGFSGVQGSNGWWYGYYDVTGDLIAGYDPTNDFAQMAYFDGSIWWPDAGNSYWTSMDADAAHPNGATNDVGRTLREQWAVRRWVSTVTDTARIHGHIADHDLCCGGDGVTTMVFVNGVKLFERSLAPGDGVGFDYDIEVQLHTNDLVDFALSAGCCGDVTSDGTYFSSIIEHADVCAPPPSGLVSWWRAEGDATDFVAGNNGTMQNVGFVPGEVGQAFAFDPLSFNPVRISIPDQPAFVLTNSLTIEAWIRPHGAGYFILLRGDHRPGLDPYGLRMLANNVLRFQIQDTNDNIAFVDTPLAYDQWWHVAGTFDGDSGAMKVYVNGALANQTNTTISPIGELNDLYPGIGIGNTGDPLINFPFNGDIDEVSLYSRALSQTEIQAIYNAGSSGKCAGPAAPYITTQPVDQTVTVGANVTFSVEAGGTEPLGYQWSFNGTNIDGATDSMLMLTDVQFTDAGTYAVVVSNSVSTATSSNAVLTVNPAPACVQPPSGLVSWWRAEGNALDEVSGNNGTLTSGAGFGAGKVGQGFALAGSSRILIGDPDSLKLTNSFTIEAWIYATGLPTGPWGQILMRSDTRTYLDPYYLAMGPDGGLRFHVEGGSYTPSPGADVDTAPIPFNQWKHVAGVFDATTGSMKLFIDGALVVQTNTTVRPFRDLDPSSSPSVTIGNTMGYNQAFNGVIDELSVCNRALSDTEIQGIYDAGSAGKCRVPHTATANAVLSYGFVVAANITNGGYGYTNTPLVRFIGGGGSGAQAVAVVSNGVVVAVNVLDAGYGYTNAPVVVIEPPFIPNPVLGIAPMSFLSFSNLTVAGDYQLQKFMGWYWTNEPVSFTATDTNYTQIVAGVAGSGDYRLALSPVPSQAFATAQVVNGFIVGATITAGGSGYVTPPAVNIIADAGSNATAVAVISGGVVTNIIITDSGIGYTNQVTVQIDPPPAAAVYPTVLPMMRLDSASLSPYDDYQIQFKPDFGAAWANWAGGLFSPIAETDSRYLFITNATGFFRLQYVP
jgi:Concanavalin A-like lectin/glucanases superfamily/Immunoglobulin domain